MKKNSNLKVNNAEHNFNMLIDKNNSGSSNNRFKKQFKMDKQNENEIKLTKVDKLVQNIVQYGDESTKNSLITLLIQKIMNNKQSNSLNLVNNRQLTYNSNNNLEYQTKSQQLPQQTNPQFQN